MTTWRDIVRAIRCAVGVLVACAVATIAAAGEVRVATFNVMNYLCMDRRIEGRFAPRYPKPEAEKAAVRAILREVDADVVCLQEIGPAPFLDELRQDLAREGLDYPHAALLQAADPLRHVAVLSRLQFREIVRHPDVPIKFLDRQDRVKRGVLEVILDSPSGPWRVFVVHLKSPLTETADDPGAEQRRIAEARAVRDLVIERAGGAGALLLIAGDLNASPDSRAMKAFAQRGERPIALALRAEDSRGETWTHRQLSSDRYERLDYMLASPALAGRVRNARASIHDGVGALLGSDHRLVWVDLDFSPSRETGGEPQDASTKTPAGIAPAGVSSTKQ